MIERTWSLIIKFLKLRDILTWNLICLFYVFYDSTVLVVKRERSRKHQPVIFFKFISSYFWFLFYLPSSFAYVIYVRSLTLRFSHADFLCNFIINYIHIFFLLLFSVNMFMYNYMFQNIVQSSYNHLKRWWFSYQNCPGILCRNL